MNGDLGALFRDHRHRRTAYVSGSNAADFHVTLSEFFFVRLRLIYLDLLLAFFQRCEAETGGRDRHACESVNGRYSPCGGLRGKQLGFETSAAT